MLGNFYCHRKLYDLADQSELGVSSGRPKGQVAWKFDSVGMETVLEGVVVNGGHTGALNPTAQLRPVMGWHLPWSPGK